MEEKLRSLELREMQYYENQEKYLREMLIACHERLENLLDARDEEYLEKLQDLEEMRDQELMKLYYNEDYRLKRAQLTRDNELQIIQNESEESLNNLNEKLKVRFQAYVDYYKHPGASVFDIDSDVHQHHMNMTQKKKKLMSASSSRGPKNSGNHSGNDSDKSAMELVMLGYDVDLRHFEDWSQPVNSRKRNANSSDMNLNGKDGDASGSGGSGAATASGYGGFLSSASAGAGGSGHGGRGNSRKPKLESLKQEEMDQDLQIMRGW